MVILADVKQSGEVMVLPPEWGYRKEQLERAPEGSQVTGFDSMGNIRTIEVGELENFREATDELKRLE